MAQGIRKRAGKNGFSYEVRVDVGVDPITGKRRQETGTFRTKKEAEAERRRLLDQRDRGVLVESTKMSVGEYLVHWLTLHEHNLKPSTRQQYGSLIRAHLIPSLGTVPLQKLQPAHLTAMYADKRANGRRDGGGGLAPRSVRHLHTVMHEALDFAVKHQMVARNVADAVDAPRFVRKEIATWTPANIRQFLTTAIGDTYDPIWLLMLTTGLRRGEALGVRWRTSISPGAV